MLKNRINRSENNSFKISKIFQKLDNLNIGVFVTSKMLVENGISLNDLTYLQRIKKVVKIKNGIYAINKKNTSEDVFAKNAYILPFLEGKNVYLTGFSALNFGNFQKSNTIQYGTNEKSIQTFSLKDKERDYNYLVSCKNYKPDLYELNINGVLVRIASNEQAVLDYLDSDEINVNFSDFYKKFYSIKDTLNQEKLLKIAIRNNQFEVIAKLGYIFGTIFSYKDFKLYNEFLEVVEKNVPKRIKLDRLGTVDGNSGNIWRIIDNVDPDSFAIN